MTSLVNRNQIWNTMPGWGIVADLTPPELITSRRMRVVRRMVFMILSLVVLACAGVYVLVSLDHGSAATALSKEQDRTTSLQRQTRMYSQVTQIQSKTTEIKTQISTLMTSDVDLSTLVGEIRTALPNSMIITTEGITISAAGAHGGTAAASTSLDDVATHKVIGTISLTGSADSYTSLATFVDRLSAVDGVVDLVPTSATADKGIVTYNISFSVTDQVLSHRWDATKKGSK